MKNLVNLSGSIAKKEVLAPIKSHILENTYVSEATDPYANYYGQVPQNAKPNSIFIYTSKFYFLEEILSCTKGAKECIQERINIASAHIQFKGKQYSAIRIKNFDDYTQIASLQECLLIEKGMVFSPKLNIQGKVEARINKLFVLEEVDDRIYIDLKEDNKGYFFHDYKVPADRFEQIITSMKNSTACKLFDAVQGEILQNGKVVEIVRVYAEGLELKFLKCMATEFKKQLTLANI